MTRSIAGLAQPRGPTPRDVVKRIRLTRAQARAWETAARRSGRTLSEWVRWVCERELAGCQSGEG